MPLIDIWESSPESVLDMTIQQIVSIAGDGHLLDNANSSIEFRDFLRKIGSKDLARYATECLENAFNDGGLALQDIVNEAGRRLGLKVTNGLYRGRREQNNSDGTWRSSDWTFIVEVKTTDAYSIKLDKIANYRSQEIAATENEKVSCLIVVGRQDTATLEDQLRGSRHNWHMRILGVDALFKAVELRESSEDPALTGRIVELLAPQEFARVDKILSTVLEFASDREDLSLALSEESAGDEGVTASDENPSRTISSDKEQIEVFKTEIAAAVSKKFDVPLTRNRSSFENAESGLRFSVAVSKLYDRRDKYWYAYHTRQKKYLADSDAGFFILGCLDTRKAFVIPLAEMNRFAADMLTTTPKGDASKIYHHVVIRQEDGRHFIYVHPTQSEFDIGMYELSPTSDQ